MRRTLVIISDLWGEERSSWWDSYCSYFSAHYSVVMYDVRLLAGVSSRDLKKEQIHDALINGGIDKVVTQILDIHKGQEYDLLGMSVGGYIAWQVAMQSPTVGRVAAISATRLRYEEQRPNAKTLVIYGELDEYKPTASWLSAMEANIRPNMPHELYKDIRVLQPWLDQFFVSPLAHTYSKSISTERYELVDVSLAGTRSILAIKSDPLIHRYLEKQPISTTSEAAAFVDTITAGVVSGKWYYWGIRPVKSIDVVGTICLWNFSADRSTADIGYELLPAHWGQGIMSECMTAVLHYGFNSLQLTSVEAYTHKDNHRSKALLHRHGFIYQEADPLGNAYECYALTKALYTGGL